MAATRVEEKAGGPEGAAEPEASSGQRSTTASAEAVLSSAPDANSGNAEANGPRGQTAGEKEDDADELVLYPLPVKGPAGEQVEVQVNPSDTIMDLRQFLADMPETCFYSCYDLILTKPDGLRYHLVDFVEIGEVADVSEGGCFVEMFNTFYDDRAVRLHVRRTRELCSMAGSYSSPSTLMALDYESTKGLATERDLNGTGEEDGAEESKKENDNAEVANSPGKEEKDPKPDKSKVKDKGKEKGKATKEEPEKKKSDPEPKAEETERMRKKQAEVAASLDQGIGSYEDTKGALASVGVRELEEDVPLCVESIAFSTFNPAPGYRRLQGDLCYLDVVTAEGKFFCVTAFTRGFFVNRSGNSRRLDPRPAEPKVESSTLVGLLRQISPAFPAAFKELMERKANRHPFENMTAPLPPVEWVSRVVQALEHTRQAARAEDALVAPFGTDVGGTSRDWNEELQSCRELPRASLQDRILRDRAVYRVSCEFVDAAVKGAKAVVGRSLPPINPHDPERFHMFVHNSIFFSWAADTDFAALQQIREAQLKAEAEKKAAEEAASSKDGAEAAEGTADSSGKETEGSGSSEQAAPQAGGPKPEDEAAAEPAAAPPAAGSAAPSPEAAESAVTAEAPSKLAASGDGEGDGEGKKQQQAAGLTEAEQASHASSNNDLKGTRAMNRADVEGLYTLGLAVIDYRGHRVIAQSIIPGILYGDRSTQMLYGSVDNGKTIKWSDKFHSKAAELAGMLGMKEHKVKDAEGKEVTLCTPVETKGILGSDDRKYLLDLVRFSPRDANFSSEEPNSPVNRLCVLRPELVAKFVKEEEAARYMAAKGLKEKPSAGEVAEAKAKGELAPVLFNMNASTEFPLSAQPKEIEEDEALVRRAGKYLLEAAIPEAVSALKGAEERPMDGTDLTATLHRHGINIRYLGKVAEAVRDVPYLWKLCVAEMAVRATKRVLKAVLRETLDQDVGGAIAHFLNCFLGTSTTAPPATIPLPEKDKLGAEPGSAKKKKKGKGGDKAAAVADGPKAGGETKEKAEGAKGAEEGKPEGDGEIEKDSRGEASFYVEGPPGYTRITGDMVWSDITEGVKYKYKFTLPEDARVLVRSVATLRNTCLKMGVTLAAKDYNLESDVPLAVADVQDLSPLVKSALPCSNDAAKFMEEGARLMTEVGLPLIPKFCSATVSPKWLRANEARLNSAFEALSEAYQILQQVSGPLHPDVATCCRYLGSIFYHAGETGNAVLHQHRELIICERLLGNDHPDTIHCYGNLGLYFQGMNEPQLGLRLCRRALRLISYVADGPHHPEIVPLLLNVALAYQDLGHTELAQKYLQEALAASERLLGEKGSSLQAAICHHALALSFSTSGSFKLALEQERKALAIFERVVGKEDDRTKESEQWVKSFLDKELRAQKQRAGLAAAAAAGPSAQQAAAAMRVAEVLKNRPDLLQAIQAAAPPPGADAAMTNSYQRAVAEVLLRSSASSGAASSSSSRQGSGPSGSNSGAPSQPRFTPTGNAGSAMRTRGVDERAARAAAEVRRKAAARGVNLRAPASAAQAQPRGGAAAVDVNDLINFINGAPPPAAARPAASGGSSTSSGPSKVAASSGVTSAPAGLGVGLGVGLGAVPLAAPPSSKAGGKKPAASGLANGDAGEYAPVGLGGGLGPLGAGGKGKSKAKKDKSGGGSD